MRRDIDRFGWLSIALPPPRGQNRRLMIISTLLFGRGQTTIKLERAPVGNKQKTCGEVFRNVNGSGIVESAYS
jgi:hypothetical protein